jgi:hypothetical protein
MKKKKISWTRKLTAFLHGHVVSLNNSKFFAGLMIIMMNIASKFATFKLSKSMEAYLKFTFSRLILVFAIAWVGTRDIYTALVVCLLFTVCMDFLFNEESRFCCLPEAFTSYHVGLMEEPDDSVQKVQEAIAILQKVTRTGGSSAGPVTTT